LSPGTNPRATCRQFVGCVSASVTHRFSQRDEIRRSRSDPNIYLFYKFQREKRWLCAIIRQLNGEGFLITTYPTDTIKEGETVWQK
jgi:hypothetical protein